MVYTTSNYHPYIPVILSPMLVCFDFFPLVSILLVLPFVWLPVGPGPPVSSHCSSHALLLVLLLIYRAVIVRKIERMFGEFNENQHMGNFLKSFTISCDNLWWKCATCVYSTRCLISSLGLRPIGLGIVRNKKSYFLSIFFSFFFFFNIIIWLFVFPTFLFISSCIKPNYLNEAL